MTNCDECTFLIDGKYTKICDRGFLNFFYIKDGECKLILDGCLRYRLKGEKSCDTCGYSKEDSYGCKCSFNNEDWVNLEGICTRWIAKEHIRIPEKSW